MVRLKKKMAKCCWRLWKDWTKLNGWMMLTKTSTFALLRVSTPMGVSIMFLFVFLWRVWCLRFCVGTVECVLKNYASLKHNNRFFGLNLPMSETDCPGLTEWVRGPSFLWETMRKEKITRGGGKGVKKFGIFKSISNFQFFIPNHLTKQKSILQVANFSFLLHTVY